MMKKVIMLLVLISLLSCNKQEERVKPITIEQLIGDKKVKNIDFVIKDKQIWSILDNDYIAIFDINYGKILDRISLPNTIFKKIYLDKKNNIIVLDKDNEIHKYDASSNTWKTIYRSFNKIYDLVFSKNNNCYALTKVGIVDLKTNLNYIPEFNSEADNKKKINVNNAVFEHSRIAIDSSDNIWIALNFFEIGSRYFKFNIRERKFIKLFNDDSKVSNNYFLNINFFNKDTYLSFVPVSPFEGFGFIYKFEDNICRLFFNGAYISDSNDIIQQYYREAYLIKYNKYDSSLYVLTTNGFFKIKQNLQSPTKITSEVVLPITYKWLMEKLNIFYIIEPPSPDDLLIVKMEVLHKNHLVFASNRFGLGIYNGKYLIFIKSVNDRARIIVEVK